MHIEPGIRRNHTQITFRPCIRVKTIPSTLINRALIAVVDAPRSTQSLARRVAHYARRRRRVAGMDAPMALKAATTRLLNAYLNEMRRAPIFSKNQETTNEYRFHQ